MNATDVITGNARWAVETSDALSFLKALPDASVNCCVTSPPYFGLRDYGHAGQIGLEPTPDEFIARLVSVFAEVRRVLTDDGTCWVNLGDSYATQPGKGGNVPQTKHPKNDYPSSAPHRSKSFDGLKPKDLIGIPWMFAFAARSEGWYLRQDIIWAKPNPMPESVTDRCTKSHEYVFLLTKSARYFFDHEANQEPAAYAGQSRGGSTNRYEQNAAGMDNKVYDTRNRRSVWWVQPEPYPGAHFATYPPALIRPCIETGCPVGGIVLDPFTGSGTTAEVAVSLGRRFVGSELNPDYVKLIRKRMRSVTPSLLTGGT